MLVFVNIDKWNELTLKLNPQRSNLCQCPKLFKPTTPACDLYEDTDLKCNIVKLSTFPQPTTSCDVISAFQKNINFKQGKNKSGFAYHNLLCKF